MNGLQLFQNHELGVEIRVLKIDDEEWFFARDLVEALGYTKPHTDVVKNHVDDDEILRMNFTELVRLGISDVGRKGEVLVNESGMYSLVLYSQLPQAKRFKKWITSEVLPSIRKSGRYIISSQIDSYAIADPIARAKRWIEEEEVRVKQLMLLQSQAPKVEAYDRFMESDGTYTTTNACKMLNLNRTKVFEFLRSQNLVFKNRTEATALGIGRGLFKQVMKNNFPTMVITPKGIEFLIKHSDCLKK